MSEEYKSKRTYKSGEFTVTSITLNTPKEKADEVAATLYKIFTRPSGGKTQN